MFTILVLASLVVLAMTQIAMADPISDFFGSLFGAQQAPAHGKWRRGRWTPSSGGVSALLDVAGRYVGSRNFTGFRGPWCGAAMSVIASQATGRRYWILRARDWARVGRPTTPHPGAVAVFSHHVGTVHAFDAAGNPYLAGGNQSGGFNIKRFPARSVIAYRDIEH